MVMNPNQGQENQLVNKALSKVPRPHITGMVLAQDIKFGDLQLNSVDDDGVIWVCTDIVGWWSLPDPESQDLDKGWGDGSYQSKGRYRARQIELSGTILVQDPKQVTKARDTLVRATDLVRKSAWLVVNEADYTKAVQVRLSGKPKIENVNPRGRIDFSIGLLAVDPIKYRWYGDATTTDLAKAQPKNSSGSESGYVTANNQGNYNVGAVFEVEGPIVSPNFTIINETNGDMLTVIEQTRGKMYRYPNSKKMLDGTATLNLTAKYDLAVGDEIEITLPETVSVTNFAVSNASIATFTTGTTTHGFVANDVVTFTNVHASVNGLELTVYSAPTYNTFTASVGTSNVNSTAVTGTSLNITNQKFNGTHYVASLANDTTITYAVDYRDTVAQTSVVVANMSPQVFRDADILEIDTSSQEVALNGDASQKRGMLDAVINWIKLTPGDNLLQFDDSNPEKFFINRYYTVANSTANTDTTYLFATTPHGYSTSDTVVVDNVSSNVNTNVSKSIASYSSVSNVASVTSSSISGFSFSVNSYVMVSGVSNTIDGLHEVLTNTGGNAISFATTSSGNIYTTIAPEGASVRQVTKVSSYSRAGNVVTVIANAHGYVNNSTLYFSGISNTADGLYVVTAPNANALTYVTRTSGTINSTPVTTGYASRRFPITDNTTYQIVVTKSPATSNVGNANSTVSSGAIVNTDFSGEIGVTKYSVDNVNNYVTLVTSGKHGFSTGELVTLNTEDTLKPFRVGSGLNWRVDYYSRASNGQVTIVTTGLPGELPNGLSVDDSIKLAGVNDSIDGTYRLVSVNNSSFTYTINTSNTVAISNTYPDAGYIKRELEVVYYNRGTTINAVVQIDKYTQVNNLVTVTTKTGLPASFANAQNVVLFGVSNTLDYATYTATNVNYSSNTFTVVARYSQNVNSTTVSDGGVYNSSLVNVAANVTTTGNLVFVTTRTPHQLKTGDSVLLEGLTSSVDGIHRIIETPSNSKFSVIISSTASVPAKLVKAASRTGAYVTMTTSTAHGFSVGDAVYVDNTSQSTFNGDTVVYSVINTVAFTYSTNTSGTASATANVGYVANYPNAYSTQEFPIVALPDDYSLTYYSKYADTVNTVSTTTLSNTAGEVVKNSDGTVRVYFKSGWIG